MRLVGALFALAACDAHLTQGHPVDGASPPVHDDAPVHIQQDAAIDAPRACAGGDAHMTAPDGSCFVLFMTTATYADAKTACAGINAHLAYLKTLALDGAAEPFVGAHDTFIGLNDIVLENAFVWEDGTPASYTNWHSGEPNNAGNNFQEDCVVIAGARTGAQWDDRPCDSTEVPTAGKYAYLCQF